MDPKMRLPKRLLTLKNVVVPKKANRFIMAKPKYKPKFPDELVGSYWMK